jgi:hypothetical protein
MPNAYNGYSGGGAGGQSAYNLAPPDLGFMRKFGYFPNGFPRPGIHAAASRLYSKVYAGRPQGANVGPNALMGLSPEAFNKLYIGTYARDTWGAGAPGLVHDFWASGFGNVPNGATLGLGGMYQRNGQVPDAYTPQPTLPGGSKNPLNRQSYNPTPLPLAVIAGQYRPARVAPPAATTAAPINQFASLYGGPAQTPRQPSLSTPSQAPPRPAYTPPVSAPAAGVYSGTYGPRVSAGR